MASMKNLWKPNRRRSRSSWSSCTASGSINANHNAGQQMEDKRVGYRNMDAVHEKQEKEKSIATADVKKKQRQPREDNEPNLTKCYVSPLTSAEVNRA